MIGHLEGQRSQVRNRVQKVLDQRGVRIGGVISDVFGMNDRRILNGLVEGFGRDAILASLSRHVQHKPERFGDALRLSQRASTACCCAICCSITTLWKTVSRCSTGRSRVPWRRDRPVSSS